MVDMNNSNRPIGVFDSGLGGLTVVKELIRQLPQEDIVYYGDTARVPYGTKSKEAIVEYSLENTRALLRHKVKMVVVACNSSSSYALQKLKKSFRVPVIGVIEPGARRAVEISRRRRVGVIATSATVRSASYVTAIHRKGRRVKVFSQACPLFVPLVEEGWMNEKAALDIARLYLTPLKRAGIDTLILGCTHYPLLKRTLQKALGGHVTLIDSAREVAIAVRRTLEAGGMSRAPGRKGKHRFFISDRPQEFEKIAKRFMGYPIHVVSRKW